MEKSQQKKMESLLLEHYGYRGLKREQWAVMEALFARRDVLAVLPTGYGKSLCYQLPALRASARLTLVVSPLIALMKDQVDALTDRGIAATYLNSSLDAMELLLRREALREGRYRILYVSPESLQIPMIRALLREAELEHVAVDEAHCISLWGHDFRPAYRKIRDFLEELPLRPVVSAFTATATPEVCVDIETLLGLRTPFRVQGNPDRPNLLFKVERPEAPLERLLERIRERRGESGIVYCQRRKEAEAVHALLEGHGIRTGLYHGGLEDAARSRAQEDFAFDRVSVVVATNAFGMGIDKSNVRYVLHLGLPLDLSAYYQEAGRAGRDGLFAECILLHREEDFRQQQGMILASDNLPERKGVQLEKLGRMRAYAMEKGCLREHLLHHFEPERFPRRSNPGGCGNCGHCIEEGWVNQSLLGRRMLSILQEVPRRIPRSLYVQLLLGEPSRQIQAEGWHQLPSFGAMKGHSIYYVNKLVDLLVGEGVVRQGNHVLLTAKGEGILSGGSEFLLRREDLSTEEGLEERLYLQLKEVRRQLSLKENKAPYILFHDATLREMVKQRPSTLRAFQEVRGVGQRKGAYYGPPFLAAIQAFLRKEGLPPPRAKASAGFRKPLLPAVGESTHALFAQGMAIGDIARQHGIQPTTVVDHLLRAHGAGKAVDFTRIYAHQHGEAIRKAILKLGHQRLRPVREALLQEGIDVSYTDIKVVLHLHFGVHRK